MMRAADRRPAAAVGTRSRGTARRASVAAAAPRAWRHGAVVALFLAALAALAARTGQLAVADRDFLLHQGDARSVRTVGIPVHRGLIYDRNGEPLAVSARMARVWIDPSVAALSAADLARIGRALGIAAPRLERRIAAGGARYAVLARRLTPAAAGRVAALGIPGLRIEREYHRFYPAGETTAHLLGRTNIDDAGQEGVELAFDAHLAGTPGAKRVLLDESRRPIKDLDYLSAPRDGRDVHLSLDLRLQFLAYRELKDAVARHGASSASLVMLDVETASVLALANLPSFNPNDWQRRGMEGVRNRAIADVYEPGSTVKPLAVLAALEGGHFTPESKIDTHPGYMVVSGKTIEDPSNRGTLGIADVVAKSSQVGIAKMALRMPEDAVFGALQRAGFGDYTGCDLPGEALGSLSAIDLDKPIGRATLAYGYGLSASPLQLARVYLTLASGGVRRDLTVLRGAARQPPERVFDAADVAAVARMMRGVLAPGGTAPHGLPAGYSAAGKTGTARKVGAGGYDETSHIAFFAGFAPAEQPRIVLVVVVNEPRGEAVGGGAVAAPVFARVAARALRVLGVPPTAAGRTALADGAAA